MWPLVSDYKGWVFKFVIEIIPSPGCELQKCSFAKLVQRVKIIQLDHLVCELSESEAFIEVARMVYFEDFEVCLSKEGPVSESHLNEQ